MKTKPPRAPNDPNLWRCVIRIPGVMIDRLDKVKEEASAELGSNVTRATVARAAFEMSLGSLKESDGPLFFEAVRAAVVKRGRKPSLHLTQGATPPELEAIAAVYDKPEELPCDVTCRRQAFCWITRAELKRIDRPTGRTSVQAAPEEP